MRTSLFVFCYVKLVAEGNAHCLCEGYELAGGVNVLGLLADYVLEGNVYDLIALERNHSAVTAVHHEFNCRIAVARGEDSITRSGSTATLNVTESGSSCLGAGKLLKLVCLEKSPDSEQEFLQ